MKKIFLLLAFHGSLLTPISEHIAAQTSATDEAQFASKELRVCIIPAATTVYPVKKPLAIARGFGLGY